MKSFQKQFMDKLALNNKRGQVLAVPKEVIFGLGGLVIGLLFIFLFISQMFSAIPLPASGYEANASNTIRQNFSVATTSFSGNFATVGVIAGLVVIVIMLALAWRYFSNSGIQSGSMSGSY